MTTTYCDQDDVISIMGEPFIIAQCDDDMDGTLSTVEATHITTAIRRAAVEMNSALDAQYILSQLSTNDWCIECNAYLTVWYLYARKGNPPSPSVIEAVQVFREHLSEARWGRFQIPEQAPSFDHTGAVSNFRPELYKIEAPIRVIGEESTRDDPGENIKRHQAGLPGQL